MGAILQRAGAALRDVLYPQTCALCEARVEDAMSLCPDCWAETPFLTGATCQLCGTALPGEDDGAARCDDCLTHGRPWDEGRALMAYAGGGRRFVLSLKHGDRTELGTTGAHWLHRRTRDLLTEETALIPVPLHRLRLLKRRYNQAALVARELARLTGGPYLPEALHRSRATASQDHRSQADRFANLSGAITARADLTGRHVAILDDVMTSGATFAACADAARAAGAARITVLMLARVAKDR